MVTILFCIFATSILSQANCLSPSHLYLEINWPSLRYVHLALRTNGGTVPDNKPATRQGELLLLVFWNPKSNELAECQRG
jgi:hypothetical protein